MISIPEPELLPEVRFLLNRCPELAEHPERLAAILGTVGRKIFTCLEALRVEDKVLA